MKMRQHRASVFNLGTERDKRTRRSEQKRQAEEKLALIPRLIQVLGYIQYRKQLIETLPEWDSILTSPSTAATLLDLFDRAERAAHDRSMDMPENGALRLLREIPKLRNIASASAFSAENVLTIVQLAETFPPQRTVTRPQRFNGRKPKLKRTKDRDAIIVQRYRGLMAGGITPKNARGKLSWDYPYNTVKRALLRAGIKKS